MASSAGATRFNEAGAVMPRKASRPNSLYCPDACFNEAGAVMPRKVPDQVGGKAPTAGFNEAGAVMPRKAVTGSALPWARCALQ